MSFDLDEKFVLEITNREGGRTRGGYTFVKTEVCPPFFFYVKLKKPS
jgi:hypothetical protein